VDNQDYHEFTIEPTPGPGDRPQRTPKRKKNHALFKVLGAIIVIWGLLLGLFKCNASNKQERKDRDVNEPPPQTERATAEEAVTDELTRSGGVYATFTSEPMPGYGESILESTADGTELAIEPMSENKSSGVELTDQSPAELAYSPENPIVTLNSAVTPVPTDVPTAAPTAVPTPQTTLAPWTRQLVEPAMADIVNAAATPKPKVYRTPTAEELAEIEANRPRETPNVRRIILPPTVIEDIGEALAPYMASGGFSQSNSADARWALGVLAIGATGVVLVEAILESDTGSGVAW
jgi:hypothetical protein